MDYIIKFSGVHKKYLNKTILSDINIGIKENEFVFIKGVAGAGKTTLLKLIVAAEKTTYGNVFVEGRNLSSITRKKLINLRQKIGFVFEDFKLIDVQNVFDNIALPLVIAGYEADIIQKKVNYILSILKVEHLKNMYPNSLSKGEKQKIAFARAIIGDKRIILADEPTANLDLNETKLILDLLDILNKDNKTIIFTTNKEYIVKNTDKKVFFLKNGTLAE